MQKKRRLSLKGRSVKVSDSQTELVPENWCRTGVMGRVEVFTHGRNIFRTHLGPRHVAAEVPVIGSATHNRSVGALKLTQGLRGMQVQTCSSAEQHYPAAEP